MKNLLPQTKSLTGLLLATSLWKHTLVQSFCLSWFIALAAQIEVPFHPVPMVMSDWAIMLVALVAAPSVAVRAVLFFLSYAVIGIPVLPGAVAGLSLFLVPSVGYLAGFILMAAIIATLKERYPNGTFSVQLGIVIAGNIAMFVAGLSWLAYLMGWPMALRVGLLPFVWTIPIKAALAASMATYWKNWRS